MNVSNIRVAVSGVTGRMGRQLIKFLLSSKINYQPIFLTGAIARCNSKFIGCDVGELVGNRSIGIAINDSIEAIHRDFDILVDFSHSQSTLQYLQVCKSYKKNMVIGTTGFTSEELSIIRSTSNYIGIVLSPNFSVMVNLMLRLLRKSASILDANLDIEVFEMHHRYKSDLPSGTALRMREAILSGLSVNDSDKNMRQCCFEEGVERDIKINAIRAGGTVGEHSVYIVDIGERLEFTHRAFDREIFVNGAIRSVFWLGKIKVGLFDMFDVLGLDDF